MKVQKGDLLKTDFGYLLVFAVQKEGKMVRYDGYHILGTRQPKRVSFLTKNAKRVQFVENRVYDSSLHFSDDRKYAKDMKRWQKNRKRKK